LATLLSTKLIHSQDLVASFESHRFSEELSVVQVGSIEVQFLHDLGIGESGDELSAKDFVMALILVEGLLEQRPHGTMVADD
jgi:uncharacterized protein YejL (UPF0352 family)